VGHSLLQGTWEERRLCKSQKHANHHYTRKVLCRRGAHRYSSPYENSDWDIPGWFDSGEDNVAGDLAKEVSHELVTLSIIKLRAKNIQAHHYSHGSLVLGVREPKIALHPAKSGIGNV